MVSDTVSGWVLACVFRLLQSSCDLDQPTSPDVHGFFIWLYFDFFLTHCPCVLSPDRQLTAPTAAAAMAIATLTQPHASARLVLPVLTVR
jgi:hypothetical protein